MTDGTVAHAGLTAAKQTETSIFKNRRKRRVDDDDDDDDDLGAIKLGASAVRGTLSSSPPPVA